MTEERKSAARSIFSFSSASVFSSFCYLVQGLIVAKLMEPAMLGLWLGLQLIQRYGLQSHLGLLNAVNRQVPFHVGRGEEGRAAHIEKVARADLLLLTGLGLIVLILVCTMGGLERQMAFGVFSVGVATLINLHMEFHVGLFKARHQFGRASIARGVRALAMLAGLPLVYYFAFYGLCGRGIAVAAAALAACLVVNTRGQGLRIDWKETASLLRIGVPIMILGYAMVLLYSMDRVVILTFLGREPMGHYALCLAAGGVISLFPQTVGQVFYPRMVESYARDGISRSLVGICARASLVGGALAGAVCASLFFALPWLVRTYFEKYVPGLPATRIALAAYFVLAFGAGPSYFLIATAHKRRQFGVLLLSAGVMFVAGWYLSRSGLTGVAWSVVIAFACYVAGLWALVLLAKRRNAGGPGASALREG